MNRLFIAVLLAAVILCPASGYAAEVQQVQRLTYMQGAEPLFSADFNDMWNVKLDNGDITGISDDGKIWFFLGDVAGAADIFGAKKEVDDTMAQYFTDVKVVSTMDEFDLNGLEAHAIEGIAKEEGKQIVFFVVIFKVDEANIGVLLFVMDPAAEQIHLKAINAMATSISRR